MTSREHSALAPIFASVIEKRKAQFLVEFEFFFVCRGLCREWYRGRLMSTV